MAVVAGIVALGTAAAATGAAAAAGSYGIYKYFKRRARQRRRPSHDGEEELDFGQELKVYKVIETRIPPPVAPKPKRGGRRATAVVTKQPSLSKCKEVATENSESASKGTGHSSSTAVQFGSSEPFITRLYPNAVKVLPDPPKRKWPDTGSVAVAGPGVALKKKSHDHGLKDLDSSSQLQNSDIITMKTLQHKLKEEYI